MAAELTGARERAFLYLHKYIPLTSEKQCTSCPLPSALAALQCDRCLARIRELIYPAGPAVWPERVSPQFGLSRSDLRF